MEKESCKIAVLDLGTQTFRLAGASSSERKATVLFSERMNVRLGQGLIETGCFSKSALKRARNALEHFVNLSRQFGTRIVRAIGTEAFRKSANAHEILTLAQELGCPVEILTPRQEAELAVKGAFLSIQRVVSPWAMIDSGGGSTEIVINIDQRPVFFSSIPVGAVTMAELIPNLCHWKTLLDKARSFLNLAEKARGLEKHKVKQVILTGGTATTIAAVIQELAPYNPTKVRGFKITLNDLYILLKKMCSLSLEERKKVKGLEPERADIFPSGIAILAEIIRYLGLRTAIISDGGILLGLLVTAMEKECNFNVESSSARGLYV